jgi:hypothetical protein
MQCTWASYERIFAEKQILTDWGSERSRNVKLWSAALNYTSDVNYNINSCIILHTDITSFCLRSIQVEAEFKIKVLFIHLHNIP